MATPIDPEQSGITQEAWREATATCHAVRVARIIEETHDSISIVFEIPETLRDTFAYRAGQFLSIKLPFDGHVLVRSYSLASSPDVDAEHKVTVKRVDAGRVSNWLNDHVRCGNELMVVPPAGLFVLDDSGRDLVLFSGGSGITPCISILKTALATTSRNALLVYANRDPRSIIFKDELTSLDAAYPGRLQIVHTLDDDGGFITREDVLRYAGDDTQRDFYLCGPEPFMDTVEAGLAAAGVPKSQLHIERFISPPDPASANEASVEGDDAASHLTLKLAGTSHAVSVTTGETVLDAVRRAGLEPPFSCEEGYCSCCMAKLTAGTVAMKANDCLTPDLIAEGWVLTCQAQCTSRNVSLEFPD